MSGRYGVIVCPFCATPLGADLRKRTMTCVCGKTIDLLKVKPKFESSSPVEVAKAVAMAKSQVKDSKMDLPAMKQTRSRFGKIAEKARDIKDPHERLSFIAAELTRLKKDFTIDDLERVHDILGKESASDMLVAMRENGIIWEREKGKFRVV
ncbi:MAG: hypothetical protein OEV21_06505 [Thermoplasmata archaeon]|nr:hypothetical protein [Thermoplasmata archaeon]